MRRLLVAWALVLATAAQHHSDLQFSGVPPGYRQEATLVAVTKPRHVHLAYGKDTTEVVVTWSTVNSTGQSTVQYGTTPQGLNLSADGEESKLANKGVNPGTRVQFIHRVHLTGLFPNTTYYYACGGAGGWSAVFFFKTVPAGTSQLHVAVYGDLGVINARSMTLLKQETHKGAFDAIIHVGDIAYDLDIAYGAMGDLFMEMIEPLAGYLPYMVVPGNHESANDFHEYRSRFSMPEYQTTESIYNSYNIGPVHFVGVSTEVYYFGPDIEARVKTQYDWLVQDLEWAAAAVNRTQRPWIVVYGHRPMYCSSNDDQDDCHFMRNPVRAGLNATTYGLEVLLVQYGVDLAIWAHEHSYERLYPVYNGTVYKGSGDPYRNPVAPVHITTGAAGCTENFDEWSGKPSDFTAIRFNLYGYTHLDVLNSTHLSLTQLDDKDGSVADQVTIVREGHDHYPHLPVNQRP